MGEVPGERGTLGSDDVPAGVEAGFEAQQRSRKRRNPRADPEEDLQEQTIQRGKHLRDAAHPQHPAELVHQPGVALCPEALVNELDERGLVGGMGEQPGHEAAEAALRRSHLRHRLALPAFRELDAGVQELFKPLGVGWLGHGSFL